MIYTVKICTGLKSDNIFNEVFGNTGIVSQSFKELSIEADDIRVTDNGDLCFYKKVIEKEEIGEVKKNKLIIAYAKSTWVGVLKA